MLDFSSPRKAKPVITASARRSMIHYMALNIVELSCRWFVRFENEYRIQSQDIKTVQNSNYLASNDSAAGELQRIKWFLFCQTRRKLGLCCSKTNRKDLPFFVTGKINELVLLALRASQQSINSCRMLNLIAYLVVPCILGSAAWVFSQSSSDNFFQVFFFFFFLLTVLWLPHCQLWAILKGIASLPDGNHCVF